MKKKAKVKINDTKRFSVEAIMSEIHSRLGFNDLSLKYRYAQMKLNDIYYTKYRKRKEDNQRSIEKKGTLAGFISLAPLLFTIIFYFIMPIARYALTTISSIQF